MKVATAQEKKERQNFSFVSNNNNNIFLVSQRRAFGARKKERQDPLNI